MSKKMKKVLFIDRDGTIIIEPEDEQIDSLEKLEFYPKTISNLSRIATELDFLLVMVSNQDGLGTPSFPEDTFWPAHNKMLKTLENEGIRFSEILIDRSFPEDNAAGRKPRTALVEHYKNGDYDLSNSYVIGDRNTDVEFALNLGTNAILLNEKPHPKAVLNTTDWEEIYLFLKFPARKAEVVRKTKETDIIIRLNLDGSGQANIQTGLGFYDHLLAQVAKHSGCDLFIQASGDLQVDEHHTIEDIALCLGESFNKALGDKKGIDRYGFLLPMDDALAQVAIDFSGRNWLEWETKFKREKVGDMPTEMFFHFFKSFTDTAKCNLNIKAEGKNEHHKIESIFKAFGKSIKQAIKRDPDNQTVPSTKGVL
jgi:imidazoleglycerol-phosphate dehydratase/histidinol-phosphatase